MPTPAFPFETPPGYRWLADAGHVSFAAGAGLDPWHYLLTPTNIVARRPDGTRVPLTAFAQRPEGLELACFDVRDNRVDRIVRVRDSTSGPAIVAVFEDFWDWLVTVIDDVAHARRVLGLDKPSVRAGFRFPLPDAYSWLVDGGHVGFQGNTQLAPWYFLQSAALIHPKWPTELASQEFIGFAVSQNSEDTACFDYRDGQIAGIVNIHGYVGDFSVSPARYSDIWDWLKSMLLEDVAACVDYGGDE